MTFCRSSVPREPPGEILIKAATPNCSRVLLTADRNRKQESQDKRAVSKDCRTG